MGWLVHRHGVLYAQEYGYNEQFEALVADIAAKFIGISIRNANAAGLQKRRRDSRFNRLAKTPERLLNCVCYVEQSRGLASVIAW